MRGSSRDSSGLWRDADNLHILYFAPQTGSSPTRTGIQRVVVEMAKALLGKATLDFVKWDSEE
ncbi:hypothetical protein, partial [Dorea formicigenerans]|uniref:hypothetical protein n=1 Tax=Dorea formicigenerans TaxID=39486 RepID=UPI001EE01868